jgi:predicted SAM-dependent methyltransferase
MKAQLRKAATTMSRWPVLGRLVRIGVAVIRLPEFRAAYLERQAALERALQTPMTGIPSGDTAFAAEQLPTLLQALSDVNYRQLLASNGQENLVNSVPVALRKITRDLVALSKQDSELKSELSRQDSELKAELSRQDSELKVELDALNAQLALLPGQVIGEATSQAVAQTLAELSPKLAQPAEEQAEVRAHLAQLAESVTYLLGRVEFVRRELMFEMRYGASAPAADQAQLKARGEILAVEKVAHARTTGVRLNLGCGHVPLDGYLNVDRRALPGVDIVAEVDELPFAKGELAEIASAHLLEHFPLEQLRRELLPYWASLLRPGGVFRAIVPDGAAMARAFAAQEYSFESLRQVTFGGQDYDGDFHYSMFSPQSMSQILRDAGFDHVQVIAENRENGGCKEFEIVASL